MDATLEADSSPIRKPCPHYPRCVGCALIGVAYGEQMRRKREMVEQALARYPALAGLEVPPLVGSPHAFGYRNQVKLVARQARRGLLFGIYRPGTHQIVDISQCPVHHPMIADALVDARAAIEHLRVPIYDERTGTGWLRYLVLRASAWQRAVQIILVVRDRSFSGEQPLVRQLRRIRRVRSVVLNLNPLRGNVVFGEAFVPLTKEAALIEQVGGWRLKTHAGAFLQANIPIARRIYERVVAWAEPAPSEIAVDLYAGAGAISFYLTAGAKNVYGVEESAIAVRDAKENVRLNGVHNVRFYPGRSDGVLPTLQRQLDRIDIVTLNPPRKGADEMTRKAIVAAGPSRIVYVSCDPASLVRDLDWFASQGYGTEKIQPFDLLPQTEHVECVALLRRT